MNFIIEFYQSLDALNTIIFWGVIIIFLLLVVFIILMINKNKNQKNELNRKNYHDELYSDEIALPSNSRDTLIMKDDNLLIQEEKQTTFEPFVIPEITVQNELVEVERTFKAEEHVMKYDNDLFNLSHVKKNSELPLKEQPTEPPKEKTTFQMPTRPYERNVLREMSLNQTSPIGIVKNNHSSDEQRIKPINLPESQVLQGHRHQTSKPEISLPEPPSFENKTFPKSISESKSITNPELPVLDKIKVEPIPTSSNKVSDTKESSSSVTPYHQPERPSINITSQELYNKEKNSNNEMISKPAQPIIKQPQDNAKFLEEVSRKLAEADTKDEIDRTAYELQQEEDAIISYKELMAKKDTIKTIDEEDAVISIKELTERKNATEKLYNITEDEENNQFIDELKKFRNDLN